MFVDMVSSEIEKWRVSNNIDIRSHNSIHNSEAHIIHEYTSMITQSSVTGSLYWCQKTESAKADENEEDCTMSAPVYKYYRQTQMEVENQF